MGEKAWWVRGMKWKGKGRGGKGEDEETDDKTQNNSDGVSAHVTAQLVAAGLCCSQC